MNTILPQSDSQSNTEIDKLVTSREVSTPYGTLCVVKRSPLLWEVNNGDPCDYRVFPCATEARALQFVDEFREWE